MKFQCIRLRTLLFISVLYLALNNTLAQSPGLCKVDSPDGKIRAELTTDSSFHLSISYSLQVLLKPSSIFMKLDKAENPGLHPKIVKVKFRKRNDSIVAPFYVKRTLIRDQFNEMECICRGSYSLIIRAYNDGVAYRFKTTRKDSITVQNENEVFEFPEASRIIFPEMSKREGLDEFHTSFEENYKTEELLGLKTSQLAFLPVIIVPGNNLPKLLLTESDPEDYPGMFIRGSSPGQSKLNAVFAAFPLEEKISGDEFKQWVVTKRASYIARTKGTRTFPWRIIIVASSDSLLPATDMVYRLASPCRLKQTEYIQPGHCTDDWEIRMNLFNVPFRAGLNTASYKYFIDFASRYGFKYVMLDAGWSANDNLFKVNPEVDMDEVADYARENKVGLFLWTEALALGRQMDSALDQFAKWCIRGINVDFMDRNDEKMVNFYYKVAAACAKRNMMVLFHGSFPNAGMERTFPNIITRESVLGSEYNIWSDRCTPKHDLYLPFLRMVAGSMDYEPIIFNNATKETFRIVGDNVMTQGTRIHQLATNVIFDSPLQVFAGNPSMAVLEPEFTLFMAEIATSWDETLVLDAKIGEFLIMARRSGNTWFLAAMTDWTARELTVSLSFLKAGKYNLTEYKDGINADHYAADYAKSQLKVKSGEQLKIKLASGGGYVAKIEGH
jgi:alpha-glucosidase